MNMTNRERLKLFLTKILLNNENTISSIIRTHYKNEHFEILSETSYLPDDCKFTERVYHILNNLNKKPLCKLEGCENHPKFISINQGYLNFCSPKHLRNSPEFKTKLGAYFKDPDKVNKRTEKIKRTSLKKYGTDNPSKSKIVKEKISTKNKTNNQLFGEEIKKKRKETSLLKYGSEFSSQNPEVRERMKKSNLENSYRLLFHSNRLKNKVDPLFTFDEFVGSTDWKHEYPFKCKKCGEIFYDNLYGGRVPRCYKCYPISYQSQIEIDIRNWLAELIETQHNRLFDKTHELDIFIPSKNVGIEMNGNYWHSELGGKRDKNYHLNKTNFFKSKGIQILHIFEDEWNDKQDIAKSIILSKLGLIQNKIYARKCQIKEVEKTTARQFLFNNHIQGDTDSKVHLGLYFQNELVSLMSFSKPRYNKNYNWELVRFCNKINTNVIGGASKILNYFQQNHSGSIISYADLRFSTGELYKTLGFELLHQSDPNYYYLEKYKNRIHRLQFQKHKLKDKLKIFDPNLTEWQNMQLNGYDRIWDCGNLVFGLQQPMV
jgi:hypothetical protein